MPTVSMRRKVKVKPKPASPAGRQRAVCRLCGKSATSDDLLKLMSWFPVHMKERHGKEFQHIWEVIGNFGTYLFCREFDTDPDWRSSEEMQSYRREILELMDGD